MADPTAEELVRRLRTLRGQLHNTQETWFLTAAADWIEAHAGDGEKRLSDEEEQRLLERLEIRRREQCFHQPVSSGYGHVCRVCGLEL